jgi:hypothetical protein
VAALNLFEGAILPVSTGLRCLHRQKVAKQDISVAHFRVARRENPTPA